MPNVRLGSNPATDRCTGQRRLSAYERTIRPVALFGHQDPRLVFSRAMVRTQVRATVIGERNRAALSAVAARAICYAQLQQPFPAIVRCWELRNDQRHRRVRPSRHACDVRKLKILAPGMSGLQRRREVWRPRRAILRSHRLRLNRNEDRSGRSPDGRCPRCAPTSLPRRRP